MWSTQGTSQSICIEFALNSITVFVQLQPNALLYRFVYLDKTSKKIDGVFTSHCIEFTLGTVSFK